MRITDRSFPYPVLSPTRDDVTPNRFELACTGSADAKAYRVTYKFDHDNNTLKQLINTGAAGYAVHVECRDCFYRVLHTRCEESGTIEIPGDDVISQVEVTGFVVAARDIPNYFLPEAHKDYDGGSFAVRSGDILASSQTFIFEAEKDLDPLKKVSSIMQILPAEAEDAPFTVDFENSKITVFLSKTDYGLYGQARHDPRAVSSLIQGIVLPVLITGLIEASNLVKNEEVLPRWAEIIRQRLTDLNQDIRLVNQKAIEFAQNLLQQPTNRFLRDLLTSTDGGSHELKIHE